MFIATLFTIARSWKQPRCPLTDEWIKKMWYIYTVEYYSAIKRNEIGSFVEMWTQILTQITTVVAQWLRICLPMQGTWFRALAWEDPTWFGATKPMFLNKRRHRNEKPAYHNEDQPLLTAGRESPHEATKNRQFKEKKAKK